MPIRTESREAYEDGWLIGMDDTYRYAYVFLSHEEEEDPETKIKLAPLIRKYRDMKYKFVLMYSRTEDLVECTKALLSHNKGLGLDKLDDKDMLELEEQLKTTTSNK